MKLLKENIKSILVIRMNRIGDMICTIPLLKTLRKEFPDANLTVLAEEANSAIIKNEPYINKVLVYKKGMGIYRNRFINIIKTFRRMSFDLAIGVKGGFSSFLASAALLSGARIRVGYVSNRKHIMNLFYNLPVEPIDFAKTHQIDACLNLLKIIGIKEVTKDVSINISPDSKDAAYDFVTSKKLTPKDRLIILNISNNRKTSSWSPNNFAETGRFLSEKYDFKCIITGLPSHEDKALEICRDIGRSAFYYKTTQLMDFAAITSMCQLLVVGDGGASHIGAAVGTTVVALFGETNPVVWRPYGEQHIVLKAPNGNVNSIAVKDVVSAIEFRGLL